MKPGTQENPHIFESLMLTRNGFILLYLSGWDEMGSNKTKAFHNDKGLHLAPE